MLTAWCMLYVLVCSLLPYVRARCTGRALVGHSNSEFVVQASWNQLTIHNRWDQHTVADNTRQDITHIVHNLNNKIYQYWFIANLRAESWCDKTPAKMLHPVTKLCRYFVHFLPFWCDSEGPITSSSKQGSSWGGMSKVAILPRGQGYSGLPKSFLEL